MIKIDRSKDINQDNTHTMLVTCPICGQKLTDVKYVSGVIMMRIMCRRCKQYISVDIAGVK